MNELNPLELLEEAINGGLTDAGAKAQLVNKTNTSHRVPREREKPWMRQAAYMFAANWSPKQVALACDVSYERVKDLLQTPWFNEQVVQLIEQNGGKDLLTMFREEVLAAHATLCELRDDKNVSPSVRAKICFEQINRVYGTPTSKVEVSSTPASSDPVAEAARLEAEVERLRSARLGGVN